MFEDELGREPAAAGDASRRCASSGPVYLESEAIRPVLCFMSIAQSAVLTS